MDCSSMKKSSERRVPSVYASHALRHGCKGSTIVSAPRPLNVAGGGTLVSCTMTRGEFGAAKQEDGDADDVDVGTVLPHFLLHAGLK